MSKLAVPADLMSTPKAKMSVGIMSSPPATTSRLLTSPIPSPKRTAASRRTGRRSDSNPVTCWGESLHDQRCADHHKGHEYEPLKKTLGDAMHKGGTDIGCRDGSEDYSEYQRHKGKQGCQ